MALAVVATREELALEEASVVQTRVPVAAQGHANGVADVCQLIHD